MISVEFKSIGPGKCRWCKKEKDKVIALVFSDGSFVGGYCQSDFMKALEDRLENQPQEKKPEAKPAQAVPLGNALAAKV